MKQCMGCMEIYQDNTNVCPYCGYVEGTQPENTLHIEPGSILNNRYIIGKVLGYGGFGVTYIAWDSLLEQKVAIKEFLPSEFATRMLGRMEITIFSGDKEKQFMEGLVKFVEEAKKLAKFNNVPGIIKIFDCIEENNTAYIIMELLEGETLAEKLEKEKKMSADKAISMLLPVMESLRIVNNAGIIHRDIAPDNIFITKQNDIKLIDFGAARYATTSLSRSLTIIIKPGYSPEEQYRSMGDQGSWTDVYSIGATLYRMITGETPCDSMERRAYLEQNGTDLLKPISKFSNRISKSQENAILNAMNVKIEERTHDMSKLIEELTAVTDIQRIESKDTKISIMNLPIWVKITSLVAVLAVVIVALVMSRGKNTIYEENGMTRVPNLLNLSIDEAVNELKDNNLTYKIIGYTYSATMPNNSVIFQSKEVGTKVSNNSQIDIKVSKIKDTYEVSNVIAMDEKLAYELLETDGYSIKLADAQYSDIIAEGCVIKQETDETSGNKMVTVTLSKGPSTEFKYESVDTPNFVGQDFHEVLKQAKTLGVLIEVVERKAGDAKEGEILEQSIKGFNSQPKRIRKGRIVQLVVSSGTNEIKIGDYVNMNIDDVRNILIPRGIEVIEECEVNEGYEHGIIFEQNPASGTVLQTGGTVTFKVSIGSERFKMIDVSGNQEEDAIRLLKRYGLDVQIEKEYKKDVKEGCVIRQSILPGSDAKVGDKIIIYICDKESSVVLPEMVGKDSYDVIKELKQLGLEYEIESVFDENVQKGTIISADPDKDNSLTVGSKVKLTVSAGPGDIAQVFGVIGKTLEEAKSILEGDQGLVVKEKYEFTDDEDEIGIVMAQDISGVRASSGDEIELTVSKGPKGTIELAPTEHTLSVGQESVVVASCTPYGARVEWEIEDEEIVRIKPAARSATSDGKATWNTNVIGLKKGTTVLTASIVYIDGTKLTKKCRITIN